MNRLATVSAAILLATASAALHAQMPTDNDAWKGGCNTLRSVDLSHLSPASIAMTRGVPASKFVTFGFDRDAAGQHQVACTLFYLGAIAAQAGNGAKADTTASAHDVAVLAQLQVKAMSHQEPSFAESMTRMKMKAYEIKQPALTVAEEERVLNAATTIQFTAAVPSRPAQMETANLRSKH